ncbi:Coiled-coil-helix-coiled-coil-helix domain-containing protein 1 [Trichoplax sp. H2]|nr:Coiled-coil-helix-coiled-coil-helix domain-containing protein 1 [Trichoplax sp. H2]|eukprot:RDD38986.1 Coiled-coil-helix-coiled-coil-helix domain-containing protein 1 [Trichoplax sp. H2]
MVQVTRALCKKRVKGLIKEMKLRPYISNTGSNVGNATCLNEMAALMTCWKENEFQDSACGKEITAFMACTNQVAAQQSKEKEMTTDASSKNTAEVINSVLRRYDKRTQRR